MELLPLAERSLLVVEDELLIAMEVEEHVHAAGAKVVAARHLEHDLRLAETSELSAVVLDFNLGRETSAPVCISSPSGTENFSSDPTRRC